MSGIKSENHCYYYVENMSSPELLTLCHLISDCDLAYESFLHIFIVGDGEQFVVKSGEITASIDENVPPRGYVFGPGEHVNGIALQDRRKTMMHLEPQFEVKEVTSEDFVVLLSMIVHCDQSLDVKLTMAAFSGKLNEYSRTFVISKKAGSGATSLCRRGEPIAMFRTNEFEPNNVAEFLHRITGILGSEKKTSKAI